MPEYLAPGVFVEEVSFRPSQILPASTSVAAIVGPTTTGPIRGRPQLLTSYNDYLSIYGDARDLNFGGTAVTNYTAYAARAFFDNGGQVLYLARIANDVQQGGPASARPATAALAVPAAGTALIDLVARFPGSGGNVDVVLQPRRGSRLLQLRAPGPSDTVILNLNNVPASALVGSTLPANAFPLQSVIALAVLGPAPTAPPPRRQRRPSHPHRRQPDACPAAVQPGRKPAADLRGPGRNQPHGASHCLRHGDPGQRCSTRNGAGGDAAAANGRRRHTALFDPGRREHAPAIQSASAHHNAVRHHHWHDRRTDARHESRSRSGHVRAARSNRHGQPDR